MRRIVGVVRHPAATMADVVSRPAFAGPWAVILLVVIVSGGLLLSSDLGRQALVDERVRVLEELGRHVDDAQYAALESRPPISAFLTSGGRLLLAPPVTLLVALGLVGFAAAEGGRLPYRTALAIVVHASVVLAIQQLVVVPVHVLRESLTSPTTLGTVLPLLEDGTWPARLAGSIDVFGLWWVGLLAVGASAATGRPVARYLVRLVGVYVAIAATIAAGFAAFAARGLLNGGPVGGM